MNDLSAYTVRELFEEITRRELTLEDMDLIVDFKVGIYQDRYNLKVQRDRQDEEIKSISELTPRFTRVTHLELHCQRLRVEGRLSSDMIEKYLSDYKQKYFSNSDEWSPSRD